MSYPDFIEEEGRVFLSETQKEVARIHEVSQATLKALWQQDLPPKLATEGLQAEVTGEDCRQPLSMPELPALYNHETGDAHAMASASAYGVRPQQVEARGGFSLELWVHFDDLSPWQVLFDSRNEAGEGMLVQLTDRKTVSLQITSYVREAPAPCGATAARSAAGTAILDSSNPAPPTRCSFSWTGGPSLSW